MRVACVTPYWDESDAVLRRCLDSVAKQTHETVHYVVADGNPRGWLDAPGSRVRHLVLSSAHADDGNTPRGLGALLAAAEGAEAVTFLDADNTYEPDHVACCLATARAAERPDVIAARRRLVQLDGSPMTLVDEEFPRHLDTSCMFILRSGFQSLALWPLQPKALSCICDRLVFAGMKRSGLRFAATTRPTVNYYTKYAVHYRSAGVPVPDHAKPTIDVSELKRWWDLQPQQEIDIVRRLTNLPDLSFG